MNDIFYKKISYQVAGYGTYKNVKWAIVSLGSHPCAYIQNMLIGTYDNYFEIDLDVHGGITFDGDCYFNKEEENVKYLGWDYAHCDDFVSYPEIPYFENQNNKKWTYEEIKNEVFNAIDQMLNLVKENK